MNLSCLRLHGLTLVLGFIVGLALIAPSQAAEVPGLGTAANATLNNHAQSLLSLLETQGLEVSIPLQAQEIQLTPDQSTTKKSVKSLPDEDPGIFDTHMVAE